MKKFILLIIVIGLLFSLCSRKEAPVVLEPDTPLYTFGMVLAKRFPQVSPAENKVLVSAKNFEVNASEFVKLISLAVGSQRARFLDLPDEKVGQIFETNATRIGEQMLLLQTAEKAKIKISDTEVDSFLLVQAQGVGGIEGLERHVKDADLSMDYFKENLRISLVIMQYQEDYIEKAIDVSEMELQVAYEEMLKDTTATVRHILMLTQEKSDAEKKAVLKKMKDILKKAKRGDDFVELVKKYSEDPGSKEKGGLYENFLRGHMVKPFENASFTLPLGEISDIVETRYGYHIIKVIDRNVPDNKYEDVLPELTKEIRDEKKNTTIAQHLQELKEENNFKVVAFESNK